MSSTILVVEADTATATFLCDQLSADEYGTAAVGTVEGARRATAELGPQLLLLGEPAEPRGALALLAEVRAGRWPFDPPCPRSCSPPSAASSRSCARSATAPTTCWPSRSATPSCARASARCCGAPHRPAAACWSASARSRSTSAPAGCASTAPRSTSPSASSRCSCTWPPSPSACSPRTSCCGALGRPHVRRHAHTRHPRVPPAREALAQRRPLLGHQRLGVGYALRHATLGEVA
jgi:hypothetical protein